ncbi:hypothetical protein DRE_04772 [Drechslerella stenobrocha 248]|uniref:TauD/TfdA-like domain-containing protein n=1 Tax=Drechslerella stenobrocha 248 TaxID=1043628 RepID=W7HS35_9PEZI|nr:hypothetical protein DRE_04772 [Drechslerella stenobrocha 248]
MIPTIRPAIRCYTCGFSFTAGIAAASKRGLPARTLPRHLRQKPASLAPQRPGHVISNRQLSTSVARPQGAEQRREQSVSPAQERLEIPAFQFRDILAGGILPPTKSLKVNIDGQPAIFDNVLLRDSCTCPTCIDPSTQQKLFGTSDIPVEIYPRRARVAEGKLKIEWSHTLAKNAVPEANVNGFHWSFYDADDLRNASSQSLSVRATMSDWKRILWDRKIMRRAVFWIDYKDYMGDARALAQALRHLSLYGLIFIRNVPDGRVVNQVPDLAGKIGNLKNTFYGETWSVKSIPDSKNIAYTHLDLGPHMDLLYFESPPGIQFLHCVENSVQGGQSYFVDGFNAAFMLGQTYPMAYDIMTKFPVNFHYYNDARHYRFTRPVIVLKGKHDSIREGSIDHMNWGPPFQAPFTTDHNGVPVSNGTTWRTFLKGAGELGRHFDNRQNQFELYLNEGECAVFFNRRVLHARRAFDPNSGRRQLTGGYVDIDAFESACRVMAERYRDLDDKDGKDGESPTSYEYLAAGGQGRWV